MTVFKDVNTDQTNGIDDVYYTALKYYLHWLGAPTMVRKKKVRNHSGHFICCYLRSWAEGIYFFRLAVITKIYTVLRARTSPRLDLTSCITLSMLLYLSPCLTCLSLVCHLSQLRQNIFQLKFPFPFSSWLWQLKQINEAWKGQLLFFVKNCHWILGRQFSLLMGVSVSRSMK